MLSLAEQSKLLLLPPVALRLYGEEANEYKIKKVNEISKDDPNYKDHKDSIRGTIVFMPISPEKDPILVLFNIKDELTMSEVTTRYFLEDFGLLQ
ncbi:hypothetical protein [Aneurinibacillus migulanus]|uniref:hypothetical protein n=1 Tax=Aneurinibacillus migulanus TaxID=47500 RepID=UPI000FBAE19C|nr:hypothetical protein [Aneurinibacillus migulanus]GED15554.1 hypothetical protein AMI01nite_35450 [Aneurinibacillus migulanus]